MKVINIEDLKRWRASRIQSGQCNYDDMLALASFIESAERIDFTECVHCKLCPKQVDDVNRVGYLYCKRQKMLVTKSSGCTWGEEI